MSIPFLDAGTISDAIDGIEDSLRRGLDPEADPRRTIVDVDAGQILFMPSTVPGYAGVKLVTIAPGNAERGLPRIHGVYLLLDSATLSPLALLDGGALTVTRTPAVSAVAVRHLAGARARRLVVFGTGPQAWGHVEAIRQVRPIEHVGVVGRRPNAVSAFVARCHDVGLGADPAAPDAVASADVICCATTARQPLFDGALVPDHATVVSVGSHEAIRSGACTEAALNTLDELVRGEVTVVARRPRLFKSTGMAWQDLVVAAAAYRRWSS